MDTVRTVPSTVWNTSAWHSGLGKTFPGFFPLVDILGVSFLLTHSFTFYFSPIVLGTLHIQGVKGGDGVLLAYRRVKMRQVHAL